MTSDERDRMVTEQLRTALREEARTVVPAGDGLQRIQQRVAARGFRLRWRRAALAVTAAAAVAGVVIGSFALTGGGTGGDQRVGIKPLGSPTTTGPVGVTTFPADAIFPFTKVTEEQSWEQQYTEGHMPWVASARQVAISWVDYYLKQPSVHRIVATSSSGDAATVTLGRLPRGGAGQLHAVTAVRLVRFGRAWLVVGADDPQHQLTMSSPAPGTRATSPVAVSGPGFGVDEAVTLQVRDATTPKLLGVGHASFGNGTPWSANVSFAAPPRPVGVLAAVDFSAADGLPSAITAEQLRFSSTGSGPPANAGPHSVFYGIAHGRVAGFDATNGARLRFLTSPHAGSLSDPQVEGGTVYFRQAAGGCGGDALMSAATAPGGARQTTLVQRPDAGYRIDGYAVSSEGRQVALVESACDPQATSPQGRVVSTDTATGTRHVIGFPSYPPQPIADPSWEPDGRHLDVVVRTGMAAAPLRYDAFAASGWVDSTAGCAGFDSAGGLPEALDVDPSGALWVAAQTGSSMQVSRCTAGKATVAFAVPGNDQPADVDVTSDGADVLLTDAAGQVWRWDGSGAASRVTGAPGLTQVSW